RRRASAVDFRASARSARRPCGTTAEWSPRTRRCRGNDRSPARARQKLRESLQSSSRRGGRQYDTPVTTTERRSGVDLAQHGLEPTGTVYRNPTTATLYTRTLERRQGVLAEGGPLVVDTGAHTGRSPDDKFVAREPGSEGRIWWSSVNRALDEECF